MYKYLVELIVVDSYDVEFVASQAYSPQAAIIKVQETYTEDKFKVVGIYKKIEL